MKSRLIAALILACNALTVPAYAQQSERFTAEVVVVSDYVLRGFSRSTSESAVQLGLAYRLPSGFVAGGWASTVRFESNAGVPDEREVELQGYLGFGRSLGRGWSASALFVRYEFPDAGGVDNGYHEFSTSLYFRELAAVTVSYTPQYLGGAASGVFVELSGRYPLASGFDLSAGLGHSELDFGATNTDTYTYGHVAVGRSLGRVNMSLGYYFSNAQAYPRWGQVADDNWAFVISTRLPWSTAASVRSN
ncbi:MAG: TorF family putative porin [Acidobacteriota bacterium]